MKAWHFLLPLAAMAAMGFAFEKSERDAAVAELRSAREAFAKSGPSMQRTSLGPAASLSPTQAAAVTAVAAQERYQRAFAGETRDGSWAESAERLAGDRLKALVPQGSSVRSVECRASLCRLETIHPDHATYETFVRSAFIGPVAGVWNAPQFTTLVGPRAQHDSLDAVSYLAREGRSLPTLD